MLSRKMFLKSACASGACFCGLGSMAKTMETKENKSINSTLSLMQAWVSALLISVDREQDDSACRTILKRCAVAHYRDLQMDELLQPYIGNLEAFHSFLEQKWGWKIEYRTDENYFIADENKTYCVCPMADASQKDQLPILCYCSEGFAELMFSKVVGRQVQATVISSVRRGGKTCKYKIEWS